MFYIMKQLIISIINVNKSNLTMMKMMIIRIKIGMPKFLGVCQIVLKSLY